MIPSDSLRFPLNNLGIFWRRRRIIAKSSVASCEWNEQEKQCNFASGIAYIYRYLFTTLEQSYSCDESGIFLAWIWHEFGIILAARQLSTIVVIF